MGGKCSHLSLESARCLDQRWLGAGALRHTYGMNLTRFTRARANVFVREINVSLPFYCEILGFTVQIQHTGFALLSRDDAELALVESQSFVKQKAAVCYIDVEGVVELSKQVTASEAVVDQAIRDHPWGMRDFVVVDPDGNKIAIGERIVT